MSETEWMQEVHPDDREQVSTDYRHHFTQENSQWTVEYRLRKAHGE